MNTNSLICTYINDHPGWREDFKNLNIAVKENEDSYAIFNYGQVADFSNPLVQEARGIIIDLNTFEVICWPFRKFGNYGESFADEIDWSSSHVQEKIDGSLTKLYHDPKKQRWMWATNGMIDAREAMCNNATTFSFHDMIIRADNYGKIPFRDLDINCTYMFELTGPQNRVVIKYDYPHLTHIGTRNNITGVESNPDIGIEKPLEYGFHTLDACLRVVQILNESDKFPKKEGFVVVDKDWNRIKIKSPEYLLYHKAATGNFAERKKYALAILMNKNLDYQQYLKEFPDQILPLKFYDYQLEKFKRDVNLFMQISRKLYVEYDFDRKAVAMVIKNHKYAPLGFAALGNSKLMAEDLVDKINIERYIPDYEAENFMDLFKKVGLE